VTLALAVWARYTGRGQRPVLFVTTSFLSGLEHDSKTDPSLVENRTILRSFVSMTLVGATPRSALVRRIVSKHASKLIERDVEVASDMASPDAASAIPTKSTWVRFNGLPLGSELGRVGHAITRHVLPDDRRPIQRGRGSLRVPEPEANWVQ
jgi:hypothetical protein